MLVYVPKETKIERKKLPPEKQVKKSLFTVTWLNVFLFGRYELSVFLIIIIFVIANSIFFALEFFTYLAIFLNPLSVYAFARFPILLSYYINDKNNEFEVDFNKKIMYFKSGRVINFSDVKEVELHKGGLFPDLMFSYYNPFGRYQYLGVILNNGDQFIITRLLMEKFINFPVLEFKFFRDPYPYIHPTKI